MSTDVTMQELELETAELLPARETLNYCGRSPSGPSQSFNLFGGNNVNQGAVGGNTSGIGNILDGNATNVAIVL